MVKGSSSQEDKAILNVYAQIFKTHEAETDRIIIIIITF